MTITTTLFDHICRYAPRLLVALVAAIAVGSAQADWSGIWTIRPVAKTASDSPLPRAWVDLIYDPVAGRPVLVGGSGSTYRNDILQMDLPGLKWVEVEPQVANVQSPYGPPCPRDEHAVEYDAINAVYWIFGGSGYTCGSRTSVAAAGTTTSQIVDPTLPSSTVDYYKGWFVTVETNIVYSAYITAYDPATKTLSLATSIPTLQTGRSFNIRSQSGGGTWRYTPATRQWYRFEAPYSGYVGPTPISRLSPAFAYSGTDGATVMFGGAVYNDTWALDADTRSWVQLIPDGSTTSPFRRGQITNSMAYDPINDAFVLFGGRCAETSCAGVPYNNALNDTWLYRLGTNTWTRMSPPTSPAPRAQHTLTYDPVNRVMVLIGGSGALSFEDIWVYDVAANTWTQVGVTNSPGARRLHAAVYDPGSAETVMYGGNDASNATQGYFVHTLKLTKTGTPANAPPVANIAFTQTGTSTFDFNGTASNDPDGSITKYQWDFGDGASALGVTASHTYASPGTYTVKLTVTDNLGATGSATLNVSVAAPIDILFTRKFTGLVSNGGSVVSVLASGTTVPVVNGAGGTFEFTLTSSTQTTFSVVITASGTSGTTSETINVAVP